MIEIRFPTPNRKMLKLLNKYGMAEGFEPCDWGKLTYIELPKYKLAKFKKFITENRIAEAEQIEEVLSIDLPIQPPEKTALLIEYLKKNNVDFTAFVFVKLPKKNFDTFISFLNENEIEET